ncbi:serine protease 55-like [Chionomys nivalis]|uniref:serine protease 55-like n=1 Tax=Chionomys nivalis TaxID=269649 RepID=UPI002597A07D|nr:serine protease 55-like [Chionomys nivalis]
MQVGILIDFDEHCTKPYVFSQVSPFIFWLRRVTQPSRSPWPNQRPVITSPSNNLSVSTSSKDSTFISPSTGVHPHFISLPQPQALADHISVQYAMPWQATIFSCGNQICSGSIISSYWVLTAAHCVRNMNPENTLVILGLRHPRKPLRVAKVTTILLHERFRLVSQAARNDLALVLLREGQSSIHIMAPLGSIKDLNTSECWLSGPQILKQGYIFENLDMLQIQVMGASKCAYLYPDIGSSTVCYNAQAGVPEISIESMSPGSAVICRPLYGNRKWRQIGFTSLKRLATIVAPHFSWILSSTAKSGYPLDQALIPWVQRASGMPQTGLGEQEGEQGEQAEDSTLPIPKSAVQEAVWRRAAQSCRD